MLFLGVGMRGEEILWEEFGIVFPRALSDKRVALVLVPVIL